MKTNNYCETFGIPACGKSTYVNEINAINVNKKYLLHDNRLIRNIKKVIIFLLFIITNFNLFIKTYKLLNKLTFPSLGKKIKMLVYLDTILFLVIKVRKKKNQEYIFDEGLLQVLWGICYNSDYNKDFINEYLSVFQNYISDKIIYLDTELSINKQRLLDRNSSGGAELAHDVKNNSNAFERAIEIRNLIIKECSKFNLNIVKLSEEK